MTEYKELAARLRHLVSLNDPENGGPYGGYAAAEFVKAGAEAASAIEALEAERDEARRQSTDRRYFMEAMQNMLGPIGLKVVAMWKAGNVKRVHYSWGPGASTMTGEERAQYILDIEAVPRTRVDSIDGGPN